MPLDFSIFESLNDLALRHDRVEDILRFIALNAQFAFIAVLVVLFFGRDRWRSLSGPRAVALAGVSAIVALGVAHVIGSIWDRPRPYEAHPGNAHLFLSPSPDPSFPSDHATAAFALAVAVFMYRRSAGWLLLGMAALVSVARVATGTHYPSDVLGGALLGALTALALYSFPPARRGTEAIADFAVTLWERASARLAHGTRWTFRQVRGRET
jgi:undecaprenyl-diphosphatase